LIGKILDQAEVSTVVHTNREADPAGLRSLLRACERSRTVSRFVLASTIAVYGANRRDPAVFTERTPAAAEVPAGAARAADEAETLVRTFARRRPDITVSVLRLPRHRPVGRQPADAATGTPDSCPSGIGFDRGCSCCTRAMPSRCCAERQAPIILACSTLAGDGVITLTQLAAPALGGCGCPHLRPHCGCADSTPDG